MATGSTLLHQGWTEPALLASVATSLIIIAILKLFWKRRDSCNPLSVNYHFTRQCNYQCGFCFHTAKTSFVLPIDEAKRGLKLLKEAGES